MFDIEGRIVEVYDRRKMNRSDGQLNKHVRQVVLLVRGRGWGRGVKRWGGWGSSVRIPRVARVVGVPLRSVAGFSPLRSVSRLLRSAI
jgi:hypothetical protein